MRLQVQPGVDSKSNIKSTIRDREEVEVEVESNRKNLRAFRVDLNFSDDGTALPRDRAFRKWGETR